jgi:dihydrofolate synthase
MSIDLTLDRIREVAEHLPRYTRPTIHIAGTNGKGSVSAISTSVFTAANSPISVGRFNSPHLVSIYDCITFNNQNITPDDYASAREQVEKTAQEHDLQISNFEVLTLTALLAFEKAAVDIVILEVGMGGRLDATNIIPDEVVIASVLTAVDLDHQALLGNTVDEIAFQKASIARPGKPFIIGPQSHSSVVDVVQQVASNVHAVLKPALEVRERSWNHSVDGPEPQPLSFHPDTFSQPPGTPVEVYLPCFSGSILTIVPLNGAHQLDNTATALSVIDAVVSNSIVDLPILRHISPEAVSRGVKNVEWKGRLSLHRTPVTILVDGQEQTRNLILLADGAHNRASALTLASYIDGTLSSLPSSTIPLKLFYILGLSHSPPKTPLDVLQPLLPPSTPMSRPVEIGVALLEFSSPAGMPWVKPVPPADIAADVRKLVPDADIWMPAKGVSLDGALKWCARQIGEGEGLVVLAGSLYLVADLYRII